MRSFIQFVEQKSEEEKNLQATIEKLPERHKKLLKNFTIELTCKNTLNGDKEHIGIINKFSIKVAAPWNYGREFTFLHEAAHLIWEKIINNSQKKKWKRLTKLYKGKPRMNEEELFCMFYASAYANHHVETYNNQKLVSFIKSLN
jgi:hypothetical protein